MSLSYEAVLLANKVRLNETNFYYLLSLFFFLMCIWFGSIGANQLNFAWLQSRSAHNQRRRRR